MSKAVSGRYTHSMKAHLRCPQGLPFYEWTKRGQRRQVGGPEKSAREGLAAQNGKIPSKIISGL